MARRRHGDDHRTDDSRPPAPTVREPDADRVGPVLGRAWPLGLARVRSSLGVGAPGLVTPLQRSAGNAAVRSLLAPGASGATVQRQALPAADNAALVEQLHKAMAGWGTDEESIFVALQRLRRDPAAIAALKAAYQARYGDDLEAEIRDEMSGSELDLALELLGVAPGGGAAVAGGPPATPADFETAARRLHGAVSGIGTDEEAIFATLIPFNRDAAALATLKTAYKGLFGDELAADLEDDMSGSELAYALYLLNAPPATSPHPDQVAVTAPGAVSHAGTTEGGTVTAHTGTEFSIGGGPARTEGFSIGYQGGLAGDSHWLQFIWREVEVTHPVRGDYRVDQAVTTTGGTYQLTTDPDDPHYNTDSSDPSTPFYEGGFVDNRTADATTIYDHPGALVNVVNAQLAGGATKVVSRAHFNTFLVRDFRTLYHVGIDVEWEFTSPAVPPRRQTDRSEGRVDALPSGMRARLVSQYPRFSFIQ